MNLSVILERFFCTISSVVYRVILTTYGLLICYLNENYFTNLEYAVAFSIYTVVTISVFVFKIERFPAFRLFLDFAFITFMLYGKDINSLVNAGYLILPIVNSPNHTGEKRTILLFVVILFATGILLHKNASPINGSYIPFLLPLAAFTTVGMLDAWKRRIVNFLNSLNGILDTIHTSKTPLHKIHRAYREVIKIVNGKFSNYIEIRYLICVEKTKAGFSLVNASNFIFDLEIDDFGAVCKRCEATGMARRMLVTIDGEEYSNTLFSDQGKLVFIVVFADKMNILVATLAQLQVFSPMFSRFAQFIEVEQNLNHLRSDLLTKLKDHIEYIDESAVSFHYIKNAMDPILSMVNAYDRYQRNDDKSEAYFGVFRDVYPRARDRAKEIQQKTEGLLFSKEKLAFTDVVDISIGKIFSIIRHTCGGIVHPIELKNNWPTEIFGEKVYANLDGLQMVVAELRDNINKNATKNAQLVFEHSHEDYSVTFCNDCRSKQKKTIQAIEAYNTREAEEALARSCIGIINLKRLCNDMGVDVVARLDGNWFCVTLMFERTEIKEEEV